MGKANFRQYTYAAITVAIVLLLLEGGARLLESQLLPSPSSDSDRPGWQTEFFGSLFDWHEPDPDLLWRFRAGLENPLITTNSHHFLGPEISREKPTNTYRVLILGDSSPVGLGLKSRRQTFAEILRHCLNQHFVSRRAVEVINAAVSGYSSDQVLRLLESRGWDYDPDLVVVYCGNNDASISGLYTDRELLAGQKLKSLRAFFSHLALYRIMRGIIRPLMTTEIDNPAALKVRVSPDRFGENLQDITEQCRNRNCPVIILKPPVPCLWPAGLQFKPFLHVTGTDGQVIIPEALGAYLGRSMAYCLDEERFRALYGRADIFTREVYEAAFTDTLPPGEAVQYYTDRLASDSGNPLWLNNLGVAYWRCEEYSAAHESFKTALLNSPVRYSDSPAPAITAALSPILFNMGINILSADLHGVQIEKNSSELAEKYLDSALQVDYFSLRIKRSYWEEIDKLGGISGVAVVDLPEIFREGEGERLFIDHCHPTAEGHILIAQAIFKTILERRWL